MGSPGVSEEEASQEKEMKLLLLVVIMMVTVAAQTPPKPNLAPGDGGLWVFDPRIEAWVSTHAVEGCTPDGKNGTFSCSCPGMVQHVQAAMTRKVWEDEGYYVPPPDAERVVLQMFKRLTRFPPAGMVDKLEALVPDHCKVVAETPGWWQMKGALGTVNPVTEKPWEPCGTACKPSRCGCADSACKPHGDPGVNY